MAFAKLAQAYVTLGNDCEGAAGIAPGDGFEQ